MDPLTRTGEGLARSPSEQFEQALTWLMTDGGSVTAYYLGSERGHRAVEIRLARAAPPERVTAELTLPRGAPSSAIWTPVKAPDEETQHKWRAEHAVATRADIDDLYREIVEALNGAPRSSSWVPIEFLHRKIAGEAASPLTGIVMAPVLAVVTGLAGLVGMVALGTPLDQAAIAAIGGALAGLVAAFVPYNVVPRWARLWGRLREGRTADDVILYSYFALPIIVTVVTIVLLRVAG